MLECMIFVIDPNFISSIFLGKLVVQHGIKDLFSEGSCHMCLNLT